MLSDNAHSASQLYVAFAQQSNYHQNVTCFELKKNQKPVPIHHSEFYKRYRSVGSFPQLTSKLKEKEIKIAYDKIQHSESHYRRYYYQ